MLRIHKSSNLYGAVRYCTVTADCNFLRSIVAMTNYKLRARTEININSYQNRKSAFIWTEMN